jgi:hypothetical protein
MDKEAGLLQSMLCGELINTDSVQVLHSMGENVKRFSCLKFTLNGSSQPDPENQDVATADIRVFAQTKDRSLVVKDTMEVPGFNRWVLENFLQSCPGGSYHPDSYMG